MTGIAETTHIVFFRNNVVGAEFNFYGPRIGRLRDYINDKCRHLLGEPVDFDALFRSDVADQLEKLRAIKAFEMKIHASEASLIAQADRSLGQAFDA